MLGDYFTIQLPNNNEVVIYIDYCLMFPISINFSEMKTDQVM